MTNFLRGTAKAWVAALIAGLSTAKANASGGFTTEEWIGQIAAAVIAWNATYWVSNSGPSAPPADPVGDAV